MKCQKCGLEHQNNFCPNCGTAAKQSTIQVPTQYYNYSVSQPPNKKKANIVTAVITIAIVFIFTFAAIIGILFGESEPESVDNSNIESDQSSEIQITYIEISAQDLWNAYEDNEVAADEDYTGEDLMVTGIVSDINSKDILTSANILLTVDNTLFGCVQCNFNSENSKALANLQKGQKVTIVGTCGGLTSFNVMINNCEIQ